MLFEKEKKKIKTQFNDKKQQKNAKKVNENIY